MVFSWERKDHLSIPQTKTKVLNRMYVCVSLSPSSPTPCLWKQWHSSVSRRQPYALETANKKCLGTVYMIPNSRLVQLVLLPRQGPAQERCPEGELLHKTHSLGIPVTLPPYDLRQMAFISISWIPTMSLREAKGDCPIKVRSEDYSFRQMTQSFLRYRFYTKSKNNPDTNPDIKKHLQWGVWFPCCELVGRGSLVHKKYLLHQGAERGLQTGRVDSRILVVRSRLKVVREEVYQDSPGFPTQWLGKRVRLDHQSP